MPPKETAVSDRRDVSNAATPADPWSQAGNMEDPMDAGMDSAAPGMTRHRQQHQQMMTQRQQQQMGSMGDMPMGQNMGGMSDFGDPSMSNGAIMPAPMHQGRDHYQMGMGDGMGGWGYGDMRSQGGPA